MWYVKTIRSGKRYEDGSLPPEVWQQGGVCPTLNAFDNGSESRATILTVSNHSNPVVTEGISSPITVGSGLGIPSVPAVTASTVRRLTPVECERLQGFPDNWTEGLADSHRYKQMGNAVTVNVANYVGLLIMEAASEHV